MATEKEIEDWSAREREKWKYLVKVNTDWLTTNYLDYVNETKDVLMFKLDVHCIKLNAKMLAYRDTPDTLDDMWNIVKVELENPFFELLAERKSKVEIYKLDKMDLTPAFFEALEETFWKIRNVLVNKLRKRLQQNCDHWWTMAEDGSGRSCHKCEAVVHLW